MTQQLRQALDTYERVVRLRSEIDIWLRDHRAGDRFFAQVVDLGVTADALVRAARAAVVRASAEIPN